MSAPRPAATGARAWGPALLALVLLLAFAVHMDFLCDDGYISFRYARNLARGWGLTYNHPAVEAPVEGYSELLWVLLLAGAARLGAPLELASRGLSLAAAAGLALLLGRLLVRRDPDAPGSAWAGALALAASAPLAVWSTGGMGTMPFLLALVWTYERMYGDPERPHGLGAALGASLVVLLRADGALWVALVLGPGLLLGLLGRDRRLRDASLWAVGLSVAVFGAHLGWRLAYYGDWLPNTARVKVGFTAAVLERGGRYVVQNALSVLSLPALALLALPGLARRDRREVVGGTVVLGTVAYCLWVGGDFMCFARFLLPAVPFLVLGAAHTLAGVERRLPRALALPVLAVVGLGVAGLGAAPAFDLHPVPEATRQAYDFRYKAGRFLSERMRWAGSRRHAREWAELGRALGAVVPCDPPEVYPSIVLGAIGAAGYHCDLFVYDRYGLVTREVALREREADHLSSPGHDKAVPRSYFLEHRPTYLAARLLRPDLRPVGSNLRPAPREVVDLADVPGFGPGYELVLIAPPETPPPGGFLGESDDDADGPDDEADDGDGAGDGAAGDPGPAGDAAGDGRRRRRRDR